MAQTTIDQFYKVISSKKNSGNVKGKTSAKRKSTSAKVLEKGHTKASAAYLQKSSKANSCKTDRRQQMTQNSNNNSCSSEAIPFHTKTGVKSSPIKVMGSKTMTMSPYRSEYTSPVRNQQSTPRSPHSNSKFTPKSPSKSTSERLKYASLARKRLFKDRTEELISMTIDNLNLAKEGAIANNDIDLERVYSDGRFSYEYNRIDTTTPTRYEMSDVIVPVDTYSLHFFLAVATVFSNPINCGYFNEHELDLIFSLLTLSRNCQALFVRMLKRKHTWHRVSGIKYAEVSNDLKPVFDELVSRSIFKSSTDEEDMSVLLNLLQVDEIRKLCQESKISGTGKKHGVQSILKFCSKTRSLFPGVPSPAVRLRASANKLLGDCVLLNNTVKEVVDRIVTLLVPNRDPTETVADVFLTILRVETNQMKFPKVDTSDLPIFASKKHLLDYIEAKSTLYEALNAIEKKQWDTVRDLGTLAAQRLPLHLEMEMESLKDSTLPRHIRHFFPGYTWLKVLSKSVDAFKKSKETMPQATEFLRMLIDQDCHMRGKKGQWYSEWIKIEMHHRKNIDTSVRLLSSAVSYDNLTEVDKLNLLDRARMLIKRKSGIGQCAKDTLKQIVDSTLDKARLTFQPGSVTVEGTLCRNVTQGKSTWRIGNCMDQEVYGTVESLALHYYRCQGYPKGVHCEGAFPVTLFGTLFWDEIYNMNVPGVWVSPYQDAPLDLFTSEFYENRKEQLDTKLEIMRKFDAETMSRHLQHAFELYCEYRSVLVLQGSVFDDSSRLQEVAFCLGVEGIVGICERLMHNFALWRAGFPDLIVWNVHTKKYKIVEVKGPGDSLSTKQKLWLQYLNQLGLNTEVCYCESSTSSRKRKHEEVA